MANIQIIDLRDLLETALDDKIGDISLDSHIYEDLGLDSMAAVAMVIEIQRKTRIKIPDEDVKQLMTVADLKAYLLRISSGSVDACL